ncbi:uncharacterized protein LOC142167992 [Nicotiana tabacum]|uniref:Uncharacterized protein LOC142167992 n=1 Tax=Nicotiana tabacum TaxID=4097 RepID=A0AC58SID3_TOBAC
MKNNFEWKPECQQALKDLKKYLPSPPFLSKPKEGETLLVYIAVSDVAVSAVLVREDEGPYQKIREHEVVDFLWENIICKLGIPKEIACDNGLQFIGAKVTKFLEDLNIKRITSSPYHPIANGQAESTNKVIIQNLKKRLEVAKGNWPEELPRVLWANRTTAKSSTGETPFSLVYGA